MKIYYTLSLNNGDYYGSNSVRPKRKYIRRVKPQEQPIKASKDGMLQLANPIGRAVIQLNLEVPSNWTQDDVQALISLVTQVKE